MFDFIPAETHPPEYMLHKYWARKPHNVLSNIVKNLLPNSGKTVLDPFCGSGVFLREAMLQGHSAIGFDANPIAALISDVTCNPPDLIEFVSTLEPILEKFQSLCDRSFGKIDGSGVRYVVHNTVVKCNKCKKQVAFSLAHKIKSKYSCNSCGGKLNFNLKNLIGTEIAAIETEVKTCSDIYQIELQSKLSSTVGEPNSAYDIEFPENKRILAFEGMTTKDLFTKRNFSLLSWLADQIHRIERKNVRDAALVMFTGSIAQSSRLIAYRNNMGTGGPAWSVPGFWVPPMHLETNPAHHLNARFKKFKSGIAALRKKTSKQSTAVVFNKDVKMLDTTMNSKIDLVFLDPPYGDSVPYMEFSMIWNSFLKKSFAVGCDISVSDRLSKKGDSWDFYQSSLIEIMGKICKQLSSEGKIVITFNNNDSRAWRALISALQENSLFCNYANYQIPAVISAKAQFSQSGSYLSDVYSVYAVDGTRGYSLSFEKVIEDVRSCAVSRGGRISKALLYRVCYISFITHNLHFTLLDDLEQIIDAVFELDGEFFVLKGRTDVGESTSIREIAIQELDRSIANNDLNWNNLYFNICRSSFKIGIPEQYEVKLLLENYILIKDKSFLVLYRPPSSTMSDAQLPLF